MSLEWWLVDCFKGASILYLGSMNETPGRCFEHDEAFVLLDEPPVASHLFTPRRSLVLSEVTNWYTPEFLLAFWVAKEREHGSYETLRVLHCPAKMDQSKEVLFCGSWNHFYECEGVDYLLTQHMT